MSDLFGQTISREPLDGEKGREERGAFFTRDDLAESICKTLADHKIVPYDRAQIMEPGCGGGAFLRAAHSVWPDSKLTGIDLLPACSGPGVVTKGDLFDIRDTRYGLIIGNPDFSIAEAVVRHCMGLLEHDGHLALLLRCGFEMSQERIMLFREFPLYARAAIPQRPSFREKGGTDRYDYALYVWAAGFRGIGKLLPPIIYR